MPVGHWQIPPTQEFPTQSSVAPHFCPGLHREQVVSPPQSMSLSPPFCLPSLQVAGVHVPPVQILLTQSLPMLHILPSAQAGHIGPPQSTSVSLLFCTPSEQLAGAQTLLMQLSDWQSVLLAHFWASTHLGQLGPPQSLSVSVPFCTPSEQEGAWQVRGVPLHTPSAQSAATLQPLSSVQGEQSAPPQSTSVSSASTMPSVQCMVVHLPMPSQALPPPSLQVVPLAALTGVQAPAVQAGVAHVVPVAGHWLAAVHSTHAPLPSQSLPPLSVQRVSAAAFTVSQHPAGQVGVRQTVPSAGQSVEVAQWASPGQVAPVPPVPVEELLDVAPPAPPVLLLLVVVAWLPPSSSGRMGGWLLHEAAAPKAKESNAAGSAAPKIREFITTGSVSDISPTCQTTGPRVRCVTMS